VTLGPGIGRPGTACVDLWMTLRSRCRPVRPQHRDLALGATRAGWAGSSVSPMPSPGRGSSPSTFTVPILVGWFIGLFCGAIVLTWLYNRSGGSILLVAIWHATYNLVSGTDAAEGLLAAIATTLVIGLALALVGLEMRATHQGRRSVLGPAAAKPVRSDRDVWPSG
jgi:hypothetical protein